MMATGCRRSRVARWLVVPNPQSTRTMAVGTHRQLVDDVQRGIEQVDQVTVFGPDDGASCHELDRTVEALLKQGIEPPAGGHCVGVRVVVRDDPRGEYRGEDVEQALRLQTRSGCEDLACSPGREGIASR